MYKKILSKVIFRKQIRALNVATSISKSLKVFLIDGTIQTHKKDLSSKIAIFKEAVRQLSKNKESEYKETPFTINVVGENFNCSLDNQDLIYLIKLELPEIVIEKFKKEIGDSWNCYSKVFFTTTGESFYFNRASYFECIHRIEKPLLESLDGKQMKKISFLSPPKKIDDSFWNDWDNDDAKKEYENIIYPVLLQTLNHLIPEGKKSILELCSGDGFFCEALFTKYSDKISNYIGLEYNQVSIQKHLDLKLTHNIELLRTDITKGFPIKDSSLDIVYGCGALTHQVLASKSEALHALQESHRILKKDGYLILTGIQQSFISIKDLEDHNFEVSNYSIPPKQDKHFYICKKK